MDPFLEKHSGELLILVLSALVFVTLLIMVPQLLRSQQRTTELRHEEFLKALEQGRPMPPPDDRARAAGRTTVLVPMVVICSAATVTCFLAAYKSEHLFAVALTVWCVAGIVSLAAVTGGVALLGRLAQLTATGSDEEAEEASPARSRSD
jgi:hypothetical protein